MCKDRRTQLRVKKYTLNGVAKAICQVADNRIAVFTSLPRYVHDGSQVVVTYYEPGEFQFTVPSGVTMLDYFSAWGSGGDGYSDDNEAGGGGGGGYSSRSSITVIPGQTISFVVDSHGNQSTSGTTDATVNVIANSGEGGISGTGGSGGAVGTGSVVFSGGDGAAGVTGSGIEVYFANTNPTYQMPAGINLLSVVECWGSGGIGGDGASPFVGPGGGGGGYARESAVLVTAGNLYNVVVDTPGNEGQSTFPGDSVSIIANSGKNAAFPMAGAGGLVSANSVTFHGGNGVTPVGSGGGGGSSAGQNANGTNASGFSGGVAPTGGGNGGEGGSSTDGFIGSNPGGGGGGGDAGFDGATGGEGSVHIVFATPTPTYGGGGGSSAGTASNGDDAVEQVGGTAPTGGGDGGEGGDLDNEGNPGISPGGGGGGGQVDQNGGLGSDGQVQIAYTPDAETCPVSISFDPNLTFGRATWNLFGVDACLLKLLIADIGSAINQSLYALTDGDECEIEVTEILLIKGEESN